MPKNKRKSQKKKYLKKINCNPVIKNKTIKANSCMTKKALLDLKKSFNASHPNEIIKATKLEEIWHELNIKIKNCNREDCWLKEINNETKRKALESELFAPKQPKEWKTNPSSWLSNFDILDVLHQYEKAYSEFEFIGPTPIDFDSKPDGKRCVWADLCKFNLQDKIGKKKKIGVIFNLDKHYEDGSHWTSLFIDLENDFLFYLDSTGEERPGEVDILVKKIMNQGLYLNTPKKFKFYENSLGHQTGNNECGMYSLYFIITMLTNKKKDVKFKTLQDKIDYFLKTRISDDDAFKYRKIYFNEI
tara:strand:+ start:180 stop:1088 length:909 start_codon:yes stop_codon:yes gene_type:complete